MKQFIFLFVGREKGAIGSMQDCRRIVLAENRAEAELKLYETHEHIHKLDCVRETEVKS